MRTRLVGWPAYPRMSNYAPFMTIRTVFVPAFAFGASPRASTRGVDGLNAGSSAQLFSGQGSDQPTGIKADGRSNIQELQYVETPVPALVFRHVRRRLPEALCHYRLRKTSGLAPRLKQFA